MAEEHHTKPLTPSKYPKSHEDEEDTSISSLVVAQSKKQQQNKYILWSSISGILVLALLITVLALTVFRVKDPEINMKRVSIPQLTLSTTIPTTVKIVVDVAIKNPNVAAFRYRNSTTYLYYNGSVIGEAHTPRGTAKARRTRDMTLTVRVLTARALANPNFIIDVLTGALKVSSYTKLEGKVRILRMVNKNVVMKMNCTVVANVTSQEVLEQKCKNKVYM